MKYHPDRNKWDKEAEKKFKEINQAYDTLWDSKKKKNYDMFWSSWPNPFSWAWAQWNADFSGFEDIFSWFGWGKSGWWASFDFWDIFEEMSWFWSTRNSQTQQKKQVQLDLEHVYEVPIFQLILWCKIELQWANKKNVKLKIPRFTKPWTKFRLKWHGKSVWGKTGNLIVKVDAKMPKNISEVDMNMLERISENVWY